MEKEKDDFNRAHTHTDTPGPFDIINAVSQNVLNVGHRNPSIESLFLFLFGSAVLMSFVLLARWVKIKRKS